MKFISFGIGYLLAVLVVDVYSTVIYDFNGPKTTLNSPYNFDYYKASDSLLIMEITLKNIPPSVTAVTVIQFSYDYFQYSYSEPQKDTLKVNVDKRTREGRIMILPSLTHDQIWVDVQLRNGGGVCNETRTRIFEGRAYTTSYTGAYYWDTRHSKAVYYYYNNWERDVSGACFAPKACKIILDLKDKCKAQPKSTYGDNVECHIKESQYICTFVRAAKNFLDYKLSQTYGDNSIVGPVWEIKQETTKLSIKLELELFDNNTSVELEPTKLRTNKAIWSDTLSVTAQDISKASNVTILKYTDTTDVQFSCAQYQHRSTIIYVGFINKTDNKITTRYTTIMKRKKFMMADNGTTLCCLIYEYQEDNENHDLTITRFVKNKTLLIYQSQAESNKHVKPCLDKWWLYVLPTLLGTTILLLTLYIVKKQRWCTNSQPAEETVELDNYATTNQVLYANLDFVHNESRAEIQTEESPYANIVGGLHSL